MVNFMKVYVVVLFISFDVFIRCKLIRVMVYSILKSA